MGIILNEQQIDATYKADKWWNSSNDQVFEISGSAGTGKTFLVKYLIQRFGLELTDVLFVAYMGKAAMALARNGLPAKTIHSAIYDLEKVVVLDDDNKIVLENGKAKTRMTFVRKNKIRKGIKLIVIDEGSMVNEAIAKDLLSFNVPIIVLGDLNQLPPVFGNSAFLNNPDVILTQIMRQAEGNPIIYLAQCVLNDIPLKHGVYGNSAVISHDDLTDYILKNSDVVLTSTNKLRYEINNLFRTRIIRGLRPDKPSCGEKIICRRNNWNRCIMNNIYLMNGMSGIIDDIDNSSFNGKKVRIRFKPDFTSVAFRNVDVDYKHLFLQNPKDDESNPFDFIYDKFEFAYAITTYSSQGSQYPNVVLFNEDMGGSKEFKKKNLYTGITRASDRITIVLD